MLWPEHFDVGVAVGAVNDGCCSTGDAAIPQPYLYVGPHEGPPPGDPFWNAPFGAAATADRIGGVADVVAFFREGHARIERSRT